MKKIKLLTKLLTLSFLAMAPGIASAASGCEAMDLYNQADERNEVVIRQRGPLCSAPGACWTYTTYKVELLIGRQQETVYRTRSEQMFTGKNYYSYSFSPTEKVCTKP